MPLAILSCHFNPQRSRRRLDNLEYFLDGLGSMRDHLIMVELIFTDWRHAKEEVPRSIMPIRIHGDWDRNGMWQKEALLNIALDHVPSKYDKIAWLDCDVLFDNPSWVRDTERALERFHIVQMFSTCYKMREPDGRRRLDISLVNKRRNPQSYRRGWAHGYAWAARRPVLEEHGFYPYHIVGGADTMMAYAWMGNWDGVWLLQKSNQAWRRNYIRWAVKAWERTRGNVGYIGGNVRHLYHGITLNRSYEGRLDLLTDNRFEPDVDLKVGSNGLLEWATNKPKMHEAVRGYLLGRQEE